MLEIDIMIASPLWSGQPDAEAIVRDAIAAAAEKTAPGKSGEVAVLLTNDAAIGELNREWRGQDKPTNVLSFPAPEAKNGLPGAAYLGDIAISFETLANEAAAEDKVFAHHLAHLAIHGYLHLIGYDHMNEDDAAAMENLETALLGTLGIPDPYAIRAEG